MKCVFGPVPSRRLGLSLGIDTIPLKTCNWNCIYCQLGRTVPLTNKRLEYMPRQEILAEVAGILEDQHPPRMDWITFVGSGEPTLHAGLGWLIKEVKALTDTPVAVITNGSLLYQREVRRELASADAVLPTMDAGNAALYKKINRPHPEITFERLLIGLTSFRKEYRGHFWLEVMLVRGLNDTEQELRDIALAVNSIQPDEIHINVPDRPPAESWVQPPDEESLLLAQTILGKTSHVVHPTKEVIAFDNCKTPTKAIIDIITRHPMREETIIKSLAHWSPQKLYKELEKLVKSGDVQVIKRYGCRFYSSSSARYQKENTKPNETTE